MGSSSRLRRSVPLRGVVGANGSGKTLLAVADLLPSLAAGRPVVSAVRLLDWNAKPGDPCLNPLCDVLGHGVPESGHRPAHPGWVPLRSLSQLLDLEHCDVLLDEVGALLSSRQSQSMPFQIEALLQQLRKRDLTVTWTAPDWGRADIVLRSVSQLATLCHGYGTRRVPDRIWTSRRWVHAVSYHASDLNQFEAAKIQNPQAQNRPRKQTSEWFRVLGSDACRGYDTFEEIPAIGFSALGGTCTYCGGRRAAPKCTCPEDHGSGSAVPDGARLLRVAPGSARAREGVPGAVGSDRDVSPGPGAAGRETAPVGR